MSSFALPPDIDDLYLESKALIDAAGATDAEVEWVLGSLTGEYADEDGDDPYYDAITVIVFDGDEEAASLTFEDTTIDTIMSWLSLLGAEDTLFAQFEVL